MTSIERFFTTEFTVKRQSWSDNKSTEVTVGTFYGQVQKEAGTSRELRQQQGEAYTKQFKIWCDKDTDVKEADTLTDEDGYTYSVQLVDKKDIGINKHIEITAQRDLKYE